MKTMKKIVAILAVALMLCSILPLSVMAADTTIEFALGANGSATHADGTSKTTYTETVSGYTLTLSNVSNFYTGARDAKGNSCLKLGASSKAGGFSFTVPADVTSVIIAAGKYKSNTTKLSVNGTTHTLTKNSNDGAYDAITVDTTTNKTITLITVSGGYRAMINTITFVVAAGDAGCEHVWVDANCTTAKTCSKCGATEGEALGHDWEVISEEEATCTADGSTTYECAACGEDKVETVPALPHTYVDGFCSECGEAEPLEATITFDNTSKRTTSTTSQQVWEENGIVVTYDKNTYTNNLADYSNPIRFYAGTKVTISYPSITKVEIVANTAAYATALSSSITGSTANDKVVTYVLDEAADSVSFVPSAQVRVDSITVYFEAPAESDCEHDYVGVETQAPTCSAEGVMTYTCSKCQESYTEAIAVIPHNYVEDIIDSTCTTTGTKTYECSVCFDSYDEVIPVKPHNYVDDVCADCGHVKAYKGTIDFSSAAQRTELTTQIQIWANEGMTFTNNKLTGNNIADYTNPIRIYKNSGIVIEFPEMSKLIIDASGIGNDYLWDATLEAAGLSFTVENKIYTITFAEAVNSLELTCANQVRANSITAIVAHECVYDNACDADCNKCGTIREVGEHTYANDFDTTCDVCGAVRAVVGPVSYIAKSISEDCNGYAVLFNVEAEGIAVKAGTFVQADFTNATYNGYKLLGVGVKASNGKSEIDIPGLRMYDLEDGCAKFAFRIINIPADHLTDEITMVPYYTVEIDGVATTIEGEAVVGSYAEIAG